VYVGPGWRIAHAFGTSLPGWLVVVPRRHVIVLDELTAEEAADLGPPLRGTWAGVADLRYRPFISSGQVLAGSFESSRNWAGGNFPLPEDTGLPQTELTPGTDADLTDWASGAMRVLDELCAEYEGDPGVLGRAGTFQLKRETITQFAEAAAERWLATAALPTGQAPPGARPGSAAPAIWSWRITDRWHAQLIPW
jgi:hypothetical protein